MSRIYTEPSRTRVREVRCPACHAGPGQWCKTYRGDWFKRRESNHMERVDLYKERKK